MTTTQLAVRTPMRFPRIAQPFIALALAVMAEIGIAFFVLNVVAVPLIAVWVGIPMLLVFVPCTRWFANVPPDDAGRASSASRSSARTRSRRCPAS